MGLLDRLWTTIGDALFDASKDRDAAAAQATLAESARTIAPVVWMLGKTGAGKTSIIAALTGDSRATVGEGFQPCTRTSAIYDVPADAPLSRFLDTRGLGEPGYDPTDDMAWSEGHANLMIVVMQVADPGQDGIVEHIRTVRRRNRDWPVVVAQTGLHRLYAQVAERHPQPYPFTGGDEDLTRSDVPHSLRQALAYQRALFDGMPGGRPTFVPIDFTQPEDGFSPADYGMALLLAALAAEGPRAHAALALAKVDAAMDAIQAHARPLIYAYAIAAAGAGAVPIPLIGAGGLTGSLALMLRALAARYGVVWTPSTFAQFTGAVGGGALLWWALRYGVREALKLIPGVGTWAGGALNAASAFALSSGVGEAACVWLSYARRGEAAPQEEVRQAFAAALSEALKRGRGVGVAPAAPEGAPR